MIQLLKNQEKVEEKDARIKKLEEIEAKYKLENENYGKKIDEMSALLDKYKVQYEQQLQAQQKGYQEKLDEILQSNQEDTALLHE